MRRILVAPLGAIGKLGAAERPGAMISLQSRGEPPPRPASVPEGDHTTLLFNDVVPQTIWTEDLVPPARTHIESIVGAAHAWRADAPMLIHCWFGISRSPAAAIIVAAALEPDRPAEAIASAVREASPMATPNARMIAIADDVLERGGSLLAAVAAIGRGRDAMEGVPFALELSTIG